MLRPSRPMIRPFISSLGRWTVETVCSAVWSAATRCIAVTMISRALSWASSRARRSMDRASLTASCSASSRTASRRIALGVLGGQPGDLLQGGDLLLAAPRRGPRAGCSSSRSRSMSLRSCSSSMSARWSSCSSRGSRRRSRLPSSPRFARASSSASRCMAELLVLGLEDHVLLLRPGLGHDAGGLVLGGLHVWVAQMPRAKKPTTTPTTAATTSRAATSKLHLQFLPSGRVDGPEVLSRSRIGLRGIGFAWARDREGPRAPPALCRRPRLARRRPLGPRPVDCTAYVLRTEPATRRVGHANGVLRLARGLASAVRRGRTAWRSAESATLEATRSLARVTRLVDPVGPASAPAASSSSTRRDTAEHTSGAKPLRASSA